MAMPPIMEKLLNLQKKVDELEAWRYMRIGGVVDVTAPDLPLENCMWADGSLALFDLWPELKAKYEKGGFSGLLLPYNCSDEDKKTYPLKWVPDSANPTGLFVPRLIGLFARYCGANGAGKYNKPGVPNVTGETIGYTYGATSGYVHLPQGAYDNVGTGAEYGYMMVGGQQHVGHYEIFDASRCSAIYGGSDSIMPPSFEMPVALYLGRSAKV